GDGDGAGPLALNPDKTFDLSHGYVASGAYITEDCVEEIAPDPGPDPCDSLIVTVNKPVSNTAPTVDVGPDATIDEGDIFSRSGSFTDPDADIWTATVNYGDGSGLQPLTLNPDKTFDLSHVYADDGLYV